MQMYRNINLLKQIKGEISSRLICISYFFLETNLFLFNKLLCEKRIPFESNSADIQQNINLPNYMKLSLFISLHTGLDRNEKASIYKLAERPGFFIK